MNAVTPPKEELLILSEIEKLFEKNVITEQEKEFITLKLQETYE